MSKKKRYTIEDYIGIETNKRCSYCNSILLNCIAEPNIYWCSNPNCPKENALGLFKNKGGEK